MSFPPFLTAKVTSSPAPPLGKATLPDEVLFHELTTELNRCIISRNNNLLCMHPSSCYSKVLYFICSYNQRSYFLFHFHFTTHLRYKMLVSQANRKWGFHSMYSGFRKTKQYSVSLFVGLFKVLSLPMMNLRHECPEWYTWQICLICQMQHWSKHHRWHIHLAFLFAWFIMLLTML
jgi:hypothetical protein